ncbi:aspartate aminotransferase family protein [Cellvibrio japonicus]|uniref:Acetylornithine aminotransferase n=1 Tax=Cellvibrio japonicus (strain Ueda107) TaxID=498211 RepID=B3PC63_CELJU|nr:aspartate aminotransferase family protein [Cellvibrio japonicus]ACE85650.1 argD acetylornithine aminotransferase [Cellvibrio japonicus Ueda107]QEI13205.1 aspartate aminotransferase family protein [Cellvibrio japonicus]QEI16779.1 aspartate aminotransferase family protein [Cellvibrio japonicus]QEI20357.1 aspartate aminotransferase family protein [Cellvibrio japonicus]
MSSLMNTFGTRTLTLVRGEGSRVWDDQGKSYLDAISGIAVCGLGYSHPAVTKALAEQAATLIHVSNLYNIPQQQHLGDLLTQFSGMEKAFFSNSGAEANEAAIKIARKYGNDKGVKSPSIIVMENSFHGRTMATLSATGNTKVQIGFEPLVEGFVRVPYDDVPAVKAALAQHDNIVAILVEPVQGEGGVRVPAADYLNQLRTLADEHDLLLMLDEIQTGNGRTGTFFAFQHNGILPDVLTTAKGLGNGVPIGACLARGKAAEVFQPGNHGTTFGGNPLACSAGIAVLETLRNDNLLTRVQYLGDKLLAGFRQALAGNTKVVDIRGKGLMLGIELNAPCPELVQKGRDLGVLINVTAGSTIRLLPTFILTDAEADDLISKVVQLVTEF